MENLGIGHWAIIAVIFTALIIGFVSIKRSSPDMDGSMNIQAASLYHRLLIVAFLAFLVVAFGINGVPYLQTVALSALAVLWILNIFFCFKLASAIGQSGILWTAISAIGFFILWIPQLLLVNAANKIFRSQGLRVGFLGGATRPL